MGSEGAVVTYGRRKRRTPETECGDDEDDDHNQASCPSPPPSALPTHPGLPKRRQYFLDFGQTDFTCSTCKICGLLYARGHSEDERLHACFHKRYLHGIFFKGWKKERIVAKNADDDGRVILVLHSDPLQHQLKVKEIMKIMEKELGVELGWLLHNRCKVYMYIYSKKVIGCAVTESISQAQQILSKRTSLDTTKAPTQSNRLQMDIRQCLQRSPASDCLPSEMVTSWLKPEEPVERYTLEGEKVSWGSQMLPVCGQRTLMFGDIKFHREEIQRQSCERASVNAEITTLCMGTSVAAVCGIRGLWVSKPERRRGFATKLMDAIRSSFVYGLVLDASQCAFFEPTSDGVAFAAKYNKTDSYLVYSCSSNSSKSSCS